MRTDAPDDDRRSAQRGLLRYAAAWLGAGAVTVTLLLAVLDGSDTVQLPPVRQVDLVDAARHAGCRLERAGRRPLNPPVAGAAGVEAAAPGIYDRAPESERLLAALRRGLVVIHYRAGLDDDVVDTLAEIQRAVPEGTLLVPNSTRMPYEVAATAWGRLLGCPRLSVQAIDALRLFRGRFLGSGPVDPLASSEEHLESTHDLTGTSTTPRPTGSA